MNNEGDDLLSPIWMAAIFVVGFFGLSFTSDVIIPSLHVFVLHLAGAP